MDAIGEYEQSHPDGPHFSSFQLPDIHGLQRATDLNPPVEVPTRLPTQPIKPKRSWTPKIHLKRTSQTENLHMNRRKKENSADAIELVRVDPRPTQTTEYYLPCHYFDYMVGTSTGG